MNWNWQQRKSNIKKACFSRLSSLEKNWVFCHLNASFNSPSLETLNNVKNSTWPISTLFLLNSSIIWKSFRFLLYFNAKNCNFFNENGFHVPLNPQTILCLVLVDTLILELILPSSSQLFLQFFNALISLNLQQVFETPRFASFCFLGTMWRFCFVTFFTF